MSALQRADMWSRWRAGYPMRHTHSTAHMVASQNHRRALSHQTVAMQQAVTLRIEPHPY
jgi:hypothetical protein